MTALRDFLTGPQGLGRHGAVTVIETHAAEVYLAGIHAWKRKKPVALGYLDFSTGERRYAALRAELDLNRRFTPELYERLVPVTAEPDGSLALEGTGPPVEWLLRMHRFDQADLLCAMAAAGGLDTGMAEALADMVRAAHEVAPRRPAHGGAGGIARVAAINARALAVGPLAGPQSEALVTATWTAIAAATPLLDARRAGGFVRRCHGDLHLGNIVRRGGRPRLFDALEFDEDLGSIDVIYDLAFLLMDLIHRGAAGAANTVLNRYLLMGPEPARADELDALALLPLALSLRAAVRAHVSATQGRVAEGQVFLAEASAYLAPAPPMLLAVGGLSGTGKSLAARTAAPDLGAPPGAVILRSDERRKRMLGLDPRAPAGAGAYTPAMTARVYAGLLADAGRLLRASRSVVLDAVHARADERAAVLALARDMGVPGIGLWLTAPPDVLRARIATRRGDASDADAAVLEAQLGFAEPPGAGDWTVLDAAGSPEQTQAALVAAIAACRPRP